MPARSDPLVIVGGSRWDVAACAALRHFAEVNALPVACAFRSQDLFDNRHPNYAGDVGIGINPRLADRVRNADVLLVIGERLGEMTTSGYTLLEAPVPTQRLIHVHPGADELGRVYQPALAIVATPGAFLAMMNRERPVEASRVGRRGKGRARGVHGLAGARVRCRVRSTCGRSCNGSTRACRTMRSWRTAPATTRRGCTGYTGIRGFRTQLAPYSGSMGYGVPAAIAAKAVHRNRVVVSWNGDGCFLMNGQELATAVQYDLGVVFVVVDNGMYGTIRMHQERNYPARVFGTDLVNPDFAALARAYGATGETVLRTEEFAPAFERALAGGKPALLHLKLDPQALTLNASLDDLRAQGVAAQQKRR